MSLLKKVSNRFFFWIEFYVIGQKEHLFIPIRRTCRGHEVRIYYDHVGVTCLPVYGTSSNGHFDWQLPPASHQLPDGSGNLYVRKSLQNKTDFVEVTWLAFIFS